MAHYWRLGSPEWCRSCSARSSAPGAGCPPAEHPDKWVGSAVRGTRQAESRASTGLGILKGSPGRRAAEMRAEGVQRHTLLRIRSRRSPSPHRHSLSHRRLPVTEGSDSLSAHTRRPAALQAEKHSPGNIQFEYIRPEHTQHIRRHIVEPHCNQPAPGRLRTADQQLRNMFSPGVSGTLRPE